MVSLKNEGECKYTLYQRLRPQDYSSDYDSKQNPLVESFLALFVAKSGGGLIIPLDLSIEI